MKAKLIKKITGIYKLELDDKVIASDDVNMQKTLEIGKLSTKNCDEIFRVVDVEKLAEKFTVDESYGEISGDLFKGYIYGFNKAMELNKDKLFTEEDVRKAYIYGVSNCHSFGHSAIDHTNKVIQSLQQPTEIEVEIEMGQMRLNSDGVKVGFPDMKLPKLDSEGCLILKKI